MNRQTGPASTLVIPVPRVPAWAVPRGPGQGDVDAAYMAGSALNSPDNLVRSGAPWLGALRQWLALKAAAATVRLMRRTEDESAPRDAWYLRQPGDGPGPAGNVLLAWRKLAGRPLTLVVADLQAVADLLGVSWSDAFDDFVARIEEDVRSGGPAPVIAARAGTAVMREDPKAEALAWWMADLALSSRMGWSHAVSLLASQIHMPAPAHGFGSSSRPPRCSGIRAGRLPCRCGRRSRGLPAGRKHGVAGRTLRAVAQIAIQGGRGGHIPVAV